MLAYISTIYKKSRTTLAVLFTNTDKMYSYSVSRYLHIVEHGPVDEFNGGQLSNCVVVEVYITRDDMSFVTQCDHLLVVHHFSLHNRIVISISTFKTTV